MRAYPVYLRDLKEGLNRRGARDLETALGQRCDNDATATGWLDEVGHYSSNTSKALGGGNTGQLRRPL